MVHSHADSPDLDATTECTIDTFRATHADLFTPYDELTGDYNHPLEQPITVDYINIKLSKCRNTDPGPDGIPNRILKVLPDTALEALANLRTASLQLGFVPRA